MNINKKVLLVRQWFLRIFYLVPVAIYFGYFLNFTLTSYLPVEIHLTQKLFVALPAVSVWLDIIQAIIIIFLIKIFYNHSKKDEDKNFGFKSCIIIGLIIGVVLSTLALFNQASPSLMLFVAVLSVISACVGFYCSWDDQFWQNILLSVKFGLSQIDIALFIGLSMSLGSAMIFLPFFGGTTGIIVTILGVVISAVMYIIGAIISVLIQYFGGPSIHWFAFNDEYDDFS